MTTSDKENLRIQYHQCIENYRMFDRHVWQVPSVTILIASAIVGVAFGYLKDALIASSILLLSGMILSFSMFIAVKKYRFFQYYTIERLKEIEEKELSLNLMPLVTNKYLFNVDKKFRDDLNGKKISDELRNIFKDKGCSLENPTIKILTKDRKWEIADKGKYSIEYIGNVLNIYISKDGMNPRNWVERQHAGGWLACSVLFVFICLTGLLIFNIANGLCN